MPDKPATLFFMLPVDELTDALWEPLYELVGEESETSKDVSRMLLAIDVKSYSLDDHQFIRVKVDLKNTEKLKGEQVFLLPRHFCVAIIEGKNKKAEFGFLQKRKTRGRERQRK